MPYCVNSPSEDLFASYMRKGEWSDAGSTSLEGIRRNTNSLPPAADPQQPVDQPQEPLVDPWVVNFFANLTNDDFSLVSRAITCSPVAQKVPEHILPSPSAGHGAQESRFDAVQAPIFMNTTIASNNVAPFSATFSVANQTIESCFRMSPLHQNSLNSRSGAYKAPSSDSTLKSVKSGLESFLEGFPSIPCHPLPPGFSAAEANRRPIVHPRESRPSRAPRSRTNEFKIPRRMRTEDEGIEKLLRVLTITARSELNYWRTNFALKSGYSRHYLHDSFNLGKKAQY
jgi:hypothetical protein